MDRFLLTLLVGLSCPLWLLAQEQTSLEKAVTIEFPKEVKSFTLAEIARGQTFSYMIHVKNDVPGVIARPQDGGRAGPPGKSGLYPFEKIFGNKQSYSLSDIGLAPPLDRKKKTIVKGAYPCSFRWDGRNWTGPSDFGNPKGKPFPPGTYTLEVSLVGEVETPDGLRPYRIKSEMKVILK